MTVPAVHRPSHRPLLRPAPDGAGRIDAIVMPASRPAAYLLPAMEVAAVLGCEFVALCSGRTRLQEAAGLADEVPGLSWTLVDLHGGWRGELPPAGTAEMPEAATTRVGDLSLKRNLGLLLARAAGWQGVLFLDDDIRDLSPRTVRRAAAALRPGWAAGMLAEEFPDNSVACHALRLSGREQDVFVSGSALAVDTRLVDSFFPEVYNEDWLFLFDRVRAGQVSAVGTVRQAPYLPYADPARAAREEFGDVLAEGLMSLLHAPRSIKAADEGYWNRVIEERAALLDSVAAALAGGAAPDAAPALRAVAAGRAMLGTFDGLVLSMYLHRWREDLRTWRKFVAAVPAVGSLGGALDVLRLPALRPPTAQTSGRVKRSSYRVGSAWRDWRISVLTKPSLR